MACLFPKFFDCWYKKLKALQKKHSLLQEVNLDNINQLKMALNELERTFQPWANEYDRRVLGKNISSNLDKENDDVVLKKRKDWLEIKAVSSQLAKC